MSPSQADSQAGTDTSG